MNRLFKSQWIILLIFTATVLTACDKFKLDFETENNFELDYHSHSLEVRTKQDAPIYTGIVINGKTIHLSEYVPEHELDVTIDYDDFSARYIRGQVDEIFGEWFTIQRTDDYNTHIFIDENKDDSDRTLTIVLGWRSAVNYINIQQTKK